MVGSSVDGAETVEACWKALVDWRGHDSVTVSSTVNTLELSTSQEGWMDIVDLMKLTKLKVKGSRGSVESNAGSVSITT